MVERYVGEGGTPFEKGLSSFPRAPILLPKTFVPGEGGWRKRSVGIRRGLSERSSGLQVVLSGLFPRQDAGAGCFRPFRCEGTAFFRSKGSFRERAPGRSFFFRQVEGEV